MATDVNEQPRKKSRLRLILLAVVPLLLICVIIFLGVRMLGGGNRPPPPVAVVPVQETPVPVPDSTEEAVAVVPDSTEESVAVATTEATSESSADGATGDLTITPADNNTDGAETIPDVTVVAVITTTTTACSGNLPPTAVAGGPYTAMMGKSNAFINVDGTNSTDSDGVIAEYKWDFGDGSSSVSGASVAHDYTAVGTYVLTLTVTDSCGATGQDTTDVNIVKPTPVATGVVITSTPVVSVPVIAPVLPITPTVTPVASPPPVQQPQPPAGSAIRTIGFCYQIQRGENLFRIALKNNLLLEDLAKANGIRNKDYILSGYVIFVPTTPVNVDVQNAYQVKAGDTVGSIATQCNVAVGNLASNNGLDVNATLTPGQLIVIPLPMWPTWQQPMMWQQY